MKILLVGEYSRLHNSLKEGLEALGHTAVIAATGDGFKNYDTQYSIKSRLFENPLLQKMRRGIYRLTGTDLEKTERGIRFYRLLPRLKGFDHVQLINSDAIETHPLLAKWLYKKLLNQNGPMSLLVCGDETPVMDYNLKGGLKYSVLTPYLEGKSRAGEFTYSLKYTTKPYRKLFNWVSQNAKAIITSDLDYEIPMQKMGFATHFIPNPVNIDKITFSQPEIKDKVVIFLGINRQSYNKKGIVFFEQALDIISKKYPDKTEIIIAENVPYKEYMTLYDRAHILLDQVYGYDQGYNALEAMAKGKVVFTGAETEFTEHYKLTGRVAVNALPDAEAIASELSYLIENPQEVTTISKRARAFIEKEHHYLEITRKYLEVWRK